jgi:hypothetical protein
MYDPIADFYSKPQLGSGIAIYQGHRRQTGGGIFSSIARFAVPILRNIKEKLFRMAPVIRNKAMDIVKDSIEDIQSGKRTFVEAFSNNARKALRDQGLLPPSQEGSGINKVTKRRRKSKGITTTHRRKKRRTATKPAYRDIFASREQ